MSRIFREAFTLESADGELPEGTEAEVALESEEAANEILEADREVEMAELQEDELTDAEESLESIVMSLESLIEKDPRGLDRVAAEGYRHAVRAIVGSALDNPVASLESFGSSTECQHATELSLEGIKDTLRKIWEAIKRAVKNAIRAVGDFFAKLFGGVSKLKDRAKKVKEKAEGLKKDGAVAEGKVAIPGADRLALGGKLTEQVLFNDGPQRVQTNAIALSDNQQALAEDFYSRLTSSYTKKEEEVGEVIAKGLTRTLEEIKKKVGQELPGGRAFHTTERNTEEDGADIRVPRLGDYSRKVNFDGKNEIDVPSLDKTIALLGTLITYCESLEKKKSKRDALKKAREDAMTAGEKLVKDGEQGKLGQYWTQAKLNVALRLANRDFATVVARADGYVFSYVRAAVAACDAIVSKYKAKKD